MAKEILTGSTNQTIDVFVQDSSSTVGAGLTGLVYNAAGLTCYYRTGATASWAALSLATQTIGGAHSDGGFVQGDATNAPGMYRLDLSDAMVSSAGLLKIYLHGATNMAPTVVEIEVVAVDKYNATSFGVSRLDDTITSRVSVAALRSTLGLESDNTIAELAATPDAEPLLGPAVAWLFMGARNGGTQSSSLRTVKDDAGTTISQASVSDSGSLFTLGKFANP